MDVVKIGNMVWHAVKDDVGEQAKIRAEFKSLAATLARDPDSAARVTSATVNGQTFSATQAMTTLQRFQMLRWVVACIDNNGPISGRQTATF